MRLLFFQKHAIDIFFASQSTYTKKNPHQVLFVHGQDIPKTLFDLTPTYTRYSNNL